jgi:hypothetical protein
MTPPTLPQAQLEFQALHISLCDYGGAGFRILDHGVELDEDLSFDRYCHYLKGLKDFHNRSKLVLSDYVRQGKIKYGDIAVDTAMGQLEFDLPTVKAIVNINSVPASLREHNLEADHYVVLAKAALTPQQREKWAKTAADQNLTASTLKASINAGEVQTPAQAKSKNHGVASPHGLNAEFAIWLRRVGGIAGVMKMGPGYAEDIARELADIIDFGVELREKIAKRVI